ncbi:hypothetical protein PXH59_00530 (plasmid) [Xenorhabdus sp. SF857]|uniref:hypothetical protein n=1 Tax=Xenorhabdus bakwenae TaxID=3026967 RepID=UPI0025583901|nr:hypothetical protein [Xenorhabdus sp. SF857]WFQ78164.1 hypothetical protein PXH59_00530 [Xenorhabdus sp. SF857]
MSPVLITGSFIGVFLLGVIGTQYYTIGNLESTVEIKTQEGDQLKQTNIQLQHDLKETDDLVVDMMERLNEERLIASEREQKLAQSSHDLSAKLVQLEKEVSSHEGNKSSCMRTRIPDYAIRLLGGTTEGTDSH